MTNQLIEFEIGIGFFVFDTLKHIGSRVWYIVAYDREEAEKILDEHANKFIDKWHKEHGMVTEYDHEFLAMSAVDQVTWEPIGESIRL